MAASSSSSTSLSSSSYYPAGIIPPQDHPDFRRLYRAVRLGYSPLDDKHLDFLMHLCNIAGVSRIKGPDVLRQIENVLYANNPNEYEEIDGKLHIYKNGRDFLYPTIGLWGERDLSAYFGQVVQALYPIVLASLKGREIKVILYGVVLHDGFGDLSHICTVLEIIKNQFPTWDITALCSIAHAEQRKRTVDLILQGRRYQPEIIPVPEDVKFYETEAYQIMVSRLEAADLVMNISFPFPIPGIDLRDSTLNVYEYGCHNQAPFTSMGVAPSHLGILSYPIRNDGLFHLRCSVLRTFLLGSNDPSPRDVRQYHRVTNLVFGYVKDRMPKMSIGQKEDLAHLSEKIRKCEFHLLRIRKLRDAKHRGNRRNSLSIQIQVHEERLRGLQAELESELAYPDIPGFPWIEPFILATCCAFNRMKKNLEIIVPFEKAYFEKASQGFFHKHHIRKLEFYKKNEEGDLVRVGMTKFPISGKRVSIINPFPLCGQDVELLTAASTGIAGCVGDASLGQVLSSHKLPFYAIYSFKSVFFFNFISLAREALRQCFRGERSFALVSYFNALFSLHEEDGDLVRRCERLGMLMRDPKVYEQLEVFLAYLSKYHSANRTILEAFSRYAAHVRHPELKALEERIRSSFINADLTCSQAYEAVKQGIDSFLNVSFDGSQ